MKRLLIAGFTLALLVPALALAQSVFDGTWKLDPTTVHQSGGKARIIHLKNGWYECNCTPPVKVKADGQEHAVKGHKGFDSVAVTVINDHSIRRTDQKDGKVVSENTFTVAVDGKTATGEFSDHNGSNNAEGKAVWKRVAEGAPGSNAVAGSWRLDHVLSASGNVFDPTYKIEGDMVTSSNGAGDSYTAKLGGKAAPDMTNGKADGTVSVRMLNSHTLRETYAKNGKVTSTATLTISPDGKTMKMVLHNVKTGATTSMTHHKQ